ncbi:MAG TPA: PIG-L deacetylase family protein [Acidothermaceae bacterium]|nr:PIG-L deacetylase family protein [Acidothermaceae bacterium]
MPTNPLPDADIERILVVTAHPDDVDFGSGGTIATWTDAGIDVVYCICTDGDAGGFDLDFPRDQIAGVRRAEQTEAAKRVGVHDVRFLGYPDGRLVASLDLRRDISRVIRQVKPQRMLVQSPERDYERIGRSHPDHRAAGEAALNAIYPDARNPFMYPELRVDEGLDAWTVAETWIMGTPHAAHLPAHYVDVTETFDRKIHALRAHESQTGHMDDLDVFVGNWLKINAERGGLPEGRLAESFLVMATA